MIPVKTDIMRFKPILPHLLILSLSFALLYSGTIPALVKDWSINDNYSHGFLVPFITAYMIWHKREALGSLKIEKNNWGLLFIATGMIFHLAGNIGAELFTMRFSMIVTLFGTVLFLFGWPITKLLAIPLIYLVIMIPIPAIIWNQAAFPLQLFAAKLSGNVINAMGIPILREGNVLHLANTSLEVVDACSGLRSLTSLLALGGAFAYIVSLKPWNKWVLFFSAVPIAIIVNIIRLAITAFMAHTIGPETAHGFLHDFSGLIIFISAFLLLFTVYFLLDKLEKKFSLNTLGPEGKSGS
jgi:exosortase